MALNLGKNGRALQEAYGRVVAAGSPTDWALFTYEGNSNDLRVAGCGDGGLEEMVEELNSGKVMYAFCRVKDPNSGLPKYVLINWTGEGVNDVRKGACANHVSTVANFLKGAHVTINARAEEDVEPELIMEKVAKASGANYNFHKESSKFQDSGPQAPVGSVYQKTNAISEIKRVNKDNFWAKAEKDEENRRLEEKRRAEEERQRLERERRERELQEAAGREQRYKARSNEIEAQKRLQQQQEAENRDKEQQQWREQAEEYEARQRKGFKRSESVEKAQEAASLIAQRAVNPRDIFKQREKSMPADAVAASQPGKLRSPFLQKEVNSVPSPASPVSPARDAAPASFTPSSAWGMPPASLVPAAGQDSGYNSSIAASHVEEANLYEEPPDPSAIYEEPPQGHVDDAKYDYAVEYQQPPDLTGKGLCARALYDYQAADDTEISFDPENIITNIEMIDEGWWRGYGPDGHFGMFPANYVELIE
ncbi:drebrin-like protein isoform X1 [Falco biarmicus]|uniref:drebrin-like protein isoform X1 n=2 Tax=Falco rusticolus TaxID=120794 RepID=UPI0018869EB0|nr:drebrin-like protein isoform X1 [Falco rusticolus]XP_055552262.1 drebrin-like protein isoform X1 [Falco cherrug]XP_056218813.1 drebrin-like protein isoform X1 [Falco biarmicus]